jgi:hypothetical protein
MKYVAGGLLVLSGAATAYQGWQLLMWAIWGRPTHWLQYVALIGSLMQVLAGFVLLWRERSWPFGGIALFLTWLFWAPAVFNTARADWSHTRFKPLGTLPTVFLVAASVAIFRLARAQKQQRVAAA